MPYLNQLQVFFMREKSKVLHLGDKDHAKEELPFFSLNGALKRYLPLSKSASDIHDSNHTIGSTCSSTSISSVREPTEMFRPEKEHCNLIVPLLNRYRERLHFCLVPVPIKDRRMTLTVRKFKIGKKQGFFCSFNENILLTATRSKKRSGTTILRCAGAISTEVGVVKKNKRRASVSVRSFRKNFDTKTDVKGGRVSSSQGLSEAPLHPVCHISSNVVKLDGVREIEEWDGLQSITGFYGRKRSWPYTKAGEKYSFIHSRLFNEEGRSLDDFGEKHPEFSCEIEKDSSTSSVSLRHKDTNSSLFSVEKLNSNDFQIEFGWPLSPVQAFGLFLSLSA